MDTKLESTLLKNQQRKFLNFGLMANCQKVPKFDFKSQFSIPISLKNANLGANFLIV